MSLRRARALPRAPGLLCAIALLLPALATGQGYDYFPTGDPDDARMLALAHEYETLTEDAIHVTIAVPYGEDRFELGIFDGETGGAWDQGSASLLFELFYDPHQLYGEDQLFGSWPGNSMIDDDWWSVLITVPDPALDPLLHPASGESPAGTFFYHLKISGHRDRDSVSVFKLRVSSPARLLSRNFSFEGALHVYPHDLQAIYPRFAEPMPPEGSTFWIDEALAGNTTYDGTWRFDLHLPYSQWEIEIFDGDFDFGTDPQWPDCYPAMIPMTWSCLDDDDPDTGTEDEDVPPFVPRDPKTGKPLDGCEPESAVDHGLPADDSLFDVFRRGHCLGPPGSCQLQTAGCVRYLVRSPGPDGVQGTGDEVEYWNHNPSSQREWERFRIAPGTLLPAGVWEVEIEGLDLSNLNTWWTVFNQLPGYMVGDTVWHDRDGDGIQQDGEEGIRDVTLELLDENAQLLGAREAGDPGSYPGPGWRACEARNTGGNRPSGHGVDDLGLYCFEVGVLDRTFGGPDSADYTVRIPAAELAPGGALYEHFGAMPMPTTPSPEQLDTVHEGGGAVMSYDFGFVCPAIGSCCEGKVNQLTLRYLGTLDNAHVEVFQRKDRITVFDGPVSRGGEFSFVGKDKHGTLGPEILIEVNRQPNTQIHTSCSQPIGPGLVRGDFEVIAGSSRRGGALCPLGDDAGAGGPVYRCVCPEDADSDSDSSSKGKADTEVPEICLE